MRSEASSGRESGSTMSTLMTTFAVTRASVAVARVRNRSRCCGTLRGRDVDSQIGLGSRGGASGGLLYTTLEPSSGGAKVIYITKYLRLDERRYDRDGVCEGWRVLQVNATRQRRHKCGHEEIAGCSGSGKRPSRRNWQVLPEES